MFQMDTYVKHNSNRVVKSILQFAPKNLKLIRECESSFYNMVNTIFQPLRLQEINKFAFYNNKIEQSIFTISKN